MPSLGAHYYIDNAILAQMAGNQKARYIADMQQQISSELAKKMAENIQFSTTADSTNPYATNITGTITAESIWPELSRYSSNYYAPQQQKIESAKSSPKQYFGTFYERLKAEIDDWLSSVRADLCLR